jgi:hypothetical protein
MKNFAMIFYPVFFAFSAVRPNGLLDQIVVDGELVTVG